MRKVSFFLLLQEQDPKTYITIMDHRNNVHVVTEDYQSGFVAILYELWLSVPASERAMCGKGYAWILEFQGRHHHKTANTPPRNLIIRSLVLNRVGSCSPIN